MANPAIFLDRDGVLNEERGDYTWRLADFIVPEGVPESIRTLKSWGYVLVVITNQAGIAKGLYTKSEVIACHEKLQKAVGGLIDDLFYCPYHPSVTQSLARKPGSLLLERAIGLYEIDTPKSFMVGDRDRDLEAAAKVGVKGIKVGNEADAVPDLKAALSIIPKL